MSLWKPALRHLSAPFLLTLLLCHSGASSARAQTASPPTSKPAAASAAKTASTSPPPPKSSAASAAKTAPASSAPPNLPVSSTPAPHAIQPSTLNKATISTAAALVPAAPRVEFLRDIAPILDRSGCSTAECHGKFGGRGGLQLSLLTLSPEDDYEPLMFGGRGRRINLAAPEQSLLLLKSTNAVPHKGGPRFLVGSPEYKMFLTWIKQGARFDDKDPRLATLSLQPDKVTLKKVGQTQPLHVIATYTDGSKRDVTKQTVFQSTNGAVLQVTSGGVVTGQRWGGGAILGRYLGTIASSSFTLPQERKGAYPTIQANNVIDQLIQDNLKRLNVIPSPLCTEEDFLRRVTLDTLGRLPTPEEITAYLNDKATDKRAKCIDALLQRPEFADFRALRLSDLLRVNPAKLGQLGSRSAALFYEWIWKSVDSNKPWDQFARELITAKGSTYQNGPASFYRIETQPNDRMENIGQAFLGVRMSCARCHKHPFDRWTTDDYWNFAAFTGKMGVTGGRMYDENVIYYNHGAQVANQSVNGRNRGKIAPATFLGDKAPAAEQPDMIVGLANWMTDPKNPFFARATVNRLWSYYFGRGIIHPVDDMRATTPESVPGLLDALAKELVDHKYDIKYVIRLILNSRAYQTSSLSNASNVADDRFFSRFPLRAMPAQVLLDMLNQTTGSDELLTSYPERTRAVQTSFPVGNYFLDAFGQSHREFLADIDPKLEPNLVQTLHMINSPYINDKIRAGKTIDAVLKAAPTDDEMIRQLFLRTLCRAPLPDEIAKSSTLLKTAKDRKEGAQDLLWAILTSREFYFNH